MKAKFYFLLLFGFSLPVLLSAQFPEFRKMTIEDWHKDKWVNDSRITNDYDSKGNLISHLTEDWDSIKGWQNVYRTKQEYNSGNKLIKSTSSEWDTLTSKWIDYSITTYDLNADGTVKESLTKMWDDEENKWMDMSKVLFTYDAAKNILTETTQMDMGLGWMDLNKTTYTYNSSNQLIKELYQGLNIMTMQMVDKTQSTYEYNPDGTEYRVTEERKDNPAGPWIPSLRTTNTYIIVNNSRQLQTTIGEKYELNAWISDIRSTYSYNNDGTIKEYLEEEWDQGESKWVNSSKDMVSYKNGKMYQITGQEWKKELNQWENSSRITFDLFTSSEAVSPEERQFVRAYPNPFSSELTIESSAKTGVQYSIITTSGQIVHSAFSTATRSRVALGHLPAGTYFLIAKYGNAEQILKLIKR